MAGPDKICPRCGTPADAIARFCGGCGFDVSQSPAPGGTSEDAPRVDPKAKTAFGLPAVQMPASQAAAPQAAPAPQTAPQVQPAAQPAPAQPAAKKKGAMARTMLGMPAATVGSAGAPSAAHEARPDAPAHAQPAPAPAQPAPPNAHAAVVAGGGFAPVDDHGPTQAMPAVVPSPVAGWQAPAQPAAPAQTEPAQPSPSAAKKVAAQSNRTMLGMMAPAAAAPSAAEQPAPAQQPAQPAPSAARKVAAQSNRTMLGVVVTPGAAPPGPAPYTGAPATVPQPTDDSWSDDDVPAGVPLATRRWKLWLLLGVLVLGAVGVVLGLVFFGGSEPEVRAAVVSGEGASEVLQVDVPGAVAGTKVRFDGRELPTTAGRALFPLAEDFLHLGDNALAVEVIAPDGSAESVPVVLTVGYRVRPDLGGLGDAEPEIRIVVDAVPGSVVSIDETPVALDATGHGVHAVPVDGGSDPSVLERNFAYRVVPPGGTAPATGQVRVRVPFATLQVERPSAQSITERAQLEIAGAAHSGATVTVDGQPVEVHEGRFLTEVELPLGVSEHVVVATRDERAPRRVVLTVRRVANLAAEAASFEADPELDYARLAAAPNDYRGRKVAFVGRVYNASVHDGRATLQLVVRDCARGQRCPLWVRHDGGTQVRLNQWIRVLGEVVGEQQYRSAGGEVRSDPAVEAAFLLPTDGD